MELLDLDWPQIVSNLLRIGLAFALALPIGWEREEETRIMGLRTFPLVAVASCGYVLVALPFAGGNADAQARVLQGLITGIGFIGGGAILKEGDYVRGTATAASIWLTGALGGAVAFQSYEIAVVLAVVNFLVLWFFTPLKEDLGSRDESDTS